MKRVYIVTLQPIPPVEKNGPTLAFKLNPPTETAELMGAPLLRGDRLASSWVSDTDLPKQPERPSVEVAPEVKTKTPTKAKK